MTIAMLVLAAAAAAGAPDSPPRALTLEQALALAERNAPAMIAAEGQRRSAAAGVRQAYAAFLPSVSLSAGSSRQLPSTGGRTIVDNNGNLVTLPAEPWSHSLGLGANVTLFDGGQRFFDLQQANARRSAADVNRVSQRFATALSVAQTFFNVLAARESEAAAEAQLAQAERQLTVSVSRLRARAVTRSDSLRAEIQLRAARLSRLEARNATVVAEATLARVVGSDQPVTAAGADPAAEAELGESDAALRTLAEQGPAVAAARADLSAARAARRARWTAYLPSLGASYSRSGSGTGAELLPDGGEFDYSGSLRLSLSLPLFNQLQRETQLAQSDVAEANAEAALRDAVLGARADLAQLLGAFRAAQERVVSQTATLDAAEEDLRVQQERYAIGGSTQLDVLTSQTQLEQARRDLIRARYDLRVARAELEALVGRRL